MKILFISRFSDPNTLNSNNNVFKQASYINENFTDIDVEILNWPHNDDWSGPLPNNLISFPPKTYLRSNIMFHIFTAPLSWNEDTKVIEDDIYKKALIYGKKILKHINPDIVHLHHRHGIWWLLDSAQQLKIPTIYTNHDWGIACLRTTLLKSNNKICNGKVSVKKCSICIKRHKSILGNINEKVVDYAIGRKFIKLIIKVPLLKNIIINKGIRVNSSSFRAQTNLIRVKKVISNLSWIFTPSKFGVQFFEQFGISRELISFLPWYSDINQKNLSLIKKKHLNISYIGRISPEKGIEEFLITLNKMDYIDDIIVNIYGEIETKYAKKLYKKFKLCKNKIIWRGKCKREDIYSNSDIVVIPSKVMDNTPLNLIESLSLNIPVIVTKVHSMSEFVVEGQNGFLFEHNNLNSLENAIKRAYLFAINPKNKIFNENKDYSIHRYTKKTISVYRKICKRLN